MRIIGMALAMSLAYSSVSAGELFQNLKDDGISVNVWGRTWTIAAVDDMPDYYSATRAPYGVDGLNPYSPPARTRTHQAIRAYKGATGCKVDFPSMYQLISGVFMAKLVCLK
ncbi:hypothetical protein QEZ52_05650 [Aliisedimentitalea scapharcae]|uniref:Uncharacterized protein n=1 Tax=Aliisedimentitalea scapharcae TaxID=1524259 RepID=A0ABZ2XYZ8_9RHOB